MGLKIAPLPYSENALEPYISAANLGAHYRQYHKSYAAALNELTAGTAMVDQTLAQVIRATARSRRHRKIFQNAAQIWAHSFFWHSIRPRTSSHPTGELARRLKDDIGDTPAVLHAFEHAAQDLFGSGWLWLIVNGAKLEIVHTANADMPWLQGSTPLLVIDMWEHAYYPDYRNRRSEFVTTVARHLLNWDFAADNLAAAETKLFSPSVFAVV